MSEMTNKELGARIKTLREQRRMTQTALGRELGVDQSTVSRIEDGSRSLTARELAAASVAFGVTISALVEEQDAIPALLRAGPSDDEAARASLRIFSECIDEYRGIEVLADEPRTAS